MATEVGRQFAGALQQLKHNDKAVINFLTMLAGDYKSDAAAVVGVLEERLLSSAKASGMLTVLYLIDSIMKNIGLPYTQIVESKIGRMFLALYAKSDRKQRKAATHVRSTWGKLFSPSTLKLLDAEVVRIERDGAASRAEANQKQSISGLHEDAQARSALAAAEQQLRAGVREPRRYQELILVVNQLRERLRMPPAAAHAFPPPHVPQQPAYTAQRIGYGVPGMAEPPYPAYRADQFPNQLAAPPGRIAPRPGPQPLHGQGPYMIHNGVQVHGAPVVGPPDPRLRARPPPPLHMGQPVQTRTPAPKPMIRLPETPGSFENLLKDTGLSQLLEGIGEHSGASAATEANGAIAQEIKLEHKSLAARYDGVIKALYDALPLQCGESGRRFPVGADKELAEHKDKLFKIRERKKLPAARMRGWFADATTWVMLTDAKTEEEKTQSSAFAGDDGSAVVDEDAILQESVPVGENKGAKCGCGCSEPLEIFFDQEIEEWRYKSTVVRMDRLMKASCWLEIEQSGSVPAHLAVGAAADIKPNVSLQNNESEGNLMVEEDAGGGGAAIDAVVDSIEQPRKKQRI